MSEMNHYYYFAFRDSHDGVERNTGATLGLTEQKVTRRFIQQAKIVAGATPDAFMSGCSYLGKMTAAEFNAGYE